MSPGGGHDHFSECRNEQQSREGNFRLLALSGDWYPTPDSRVVGRVRCIVSVGSSIGFHVRRHNCRPWREPVRACKGRILTFQRGAEE
jgi:hypothetical protein